MCYIFSLSIYLLLFTLNYCICCLLIYNYEVSLFMLELYWFMLLYSYCMLYCNLVIIYYFSINILFKLLLYFFTNSYIFNNPLYCYYNYLINLYTLCLYYSIFISYLFLVVINYLLLFCTCYYKESFYFYINLIMFYI